MKSKNLLLSLMVSCPLVLVLVFQFYHPGIIPLPRLPTASQHSIKGDLQKTRNSINFLPHINTTTSTKSVSVSNSTSYNSVGRVVTNTNSNTGYKIVNSASIGQDTHADQNTRKQTNNSRHRLTLSTSVLQTTNFSANSNLVPRNEDVKSNYVNNNTINNSNNNNVKRINWENIPHWLPKYFHDDTTFSKCDFTSCMIEKQKERADAVIIYMVGYMKRVPFYRPPGQVWIFYGLESPLHLFSSVWQLPAWRDQINWTMTYRLDSTIPIPYGQVFHRPVEERPDLNQVMSKKKKLVAWVVSNCGIAESRRMKYVKQLNKHLREPVDIYGRCGTLSAGRGEEVFTKIDQEYKFYLGFENSLCYDYITEKFHERQNLNVIVIGRGWGNYSQAYPEKSYLDTRDFKTPKDLADMMHYLDDNSTAYMPYLRNKAQYKAKDRFYTMQQGLCEICKKLHQPVVPSHNPDISAWWFKDKCKSPKVFYNVVN